MKVSITQALTRQMLADGINSDAFLQKFLDWKAGDEYGNYLFGKDGAYVRPSLHGMPYALRHVHLVPLLDQKQLANWHKVWRRRGRKTSDRCLIYAGNNQQEFLLIFILPEPDAHAVAQMQTAQTTAIMAGFLEVAAEFLETGRVIA